MEANSRRTRRRPRAATEAACALVLLTLILCAPGAAANTISLAPDPDPPTLGLEDNTEKTTTAFIHYSMRTVLLPGCLLTWSTHVGGFSEDEDYTYVHGLFRTFTPVGSNFEQGGDQGPIDKTLGSGPAPDLLLPGEVVILKAEIYRDTAPQGDRAQRGPITLACLLDSLLPWDAEAAP